MEPSEINPEIERLKAQRDRYKQLAAPELRTAGAKRVFAAAAAAALRAARELPDDEREAFEAGLGKPMAQALAEGIMFQLGQQQLMVQDAAPALKAVPAA